MIMKCAWTVAICATISTMAVADSFELEGIVRDLRRGDREYGHPDFQMSGDTERLRHITGLVAPYLGEDGKPVFNPNRPPDDCINSAASFHQWYNNVPGVNASEPLTLTVDNGQSEPGGVYTFSSTSFFPIDGKLLGNQGLIHNYHFTFELHTQFTYIPGQTFTFVGDDDVWVFIDGFRIIDLGGVHSAMTGHVTLFDGKAFVTTSNGPSDDMTQEVSQAQAAYFRDAWSNLGLPGPCPIKTGDHFIDLNLTDGKPDSRVEFGGHAATVWSAAPIESIDVKFSDGSTEHFESVRNPGETTSTVAGTGRNAAKTVLGVWVHNDPKKEPTYFDADSGDGFSSQSLDFFFAERHTSQSNFRIDTNMDLQPTPIATVTALYK